MREEDKQVEEKKLGKRVQPPTEDGEIWISTPIFTIFMSVQTLLNIYFIFRLWQNSENITFLMNSTIDTLNIISPIQNRVNDIVEALRLILGLI